MPVGTLVLDRLARRPFIGSRALSWIFRACTALALTCVLAPQALAQTATVTAAWDANTDMLTRGYVVYYGTASGSYQWNYDAGAQTSAQLTLSRGSRYYFVVRAYDASATLGPSSNEATIDLGATAPTATITATLQSATSALVSWTTANAVSATINGTAVAASGSMTVPISGTTTFTIVATGASGATVTRSATVTVTAPAPTATLSASLLSATSARVTWSTSNATSAALNGAAVALSGSSTVTVSGTTTFTLVARGAGGTTTRTATVTVTQPAPTASITASMQNATTALVTWSTTNATSATINGAAVGLSGSTSTPVSATTTFTLVATGAGGTASSSATVTVSAPPSAPLAPSTLLASVSGTRVTLTWRAPSSGPAPTTYLIDVGTTWGGTEIARGFNLGNIVQISADLPRGRYYARIRAANSAGVGDYSNIASFRVGRSLVSPTGFTVQWQGTQAVLSWTQPVTNAPVEDQPTAYVLEAGTAPGLSDIGRVNVGNASTFRASVPPGRYYVRVRAVNDFGESDPTADLELVTTGTPAAPGAPRQLAASGSALTVTLRWLAPASGGPVTGYQLEAGSAPGASDISVVQVGAATSFSTPVPRGTYYVRVRALNAGGPGQASNEVTVTR